jgi:hypothetical protein
LAQDGDPEDPIDLEPQEDADVEQQDLEVEEQETDPESDEVDAASQQQDRQEPGEQRQQPTRGENRQQRLANDLREERQRRADLERRLDLALAARNQQPTPQGESPEARAQRLALLTPEERIREELQETRREIAASLQQQRFTTIEAGDRAAFQAKATVDPLYKKWEPKVEAELTQLRNQGMNVERERLMYYLIGKAAVEARGANKGTQRAAGAQRVRQQTTRSPNSGSDVQAQRRERGNSLERRLENQSL